jgi:hypothetical protein
MKYDDIIENYERNVRDVRGLLLDNIVALPIKAEENHRKSQDN